MKRILAYMLAALCLVSCNWFHHEDFSDRHSLLIYIAGNNSISSYGEQDLADIESAWLPETSDKSDILMVFTHFTDQTPKLFRLSRDKRGNLVKDIIMEYPFATNSGTTQTLQEVIDDAEEAWPAGSHGLVLWSHASGFLPPGYFSDPKEQSFSRVRQQEAAFVDPFAGMVKSFAVDGSSEMDIVELGKVLQRTYYEYIIFDCCFMADVQVAYELIPACGLLVFSPTEILGDGLPYDSMVETIFKGKDYTSSMKKLCEDYMSQYRSQTGDYASATITLLNTAKLGPLADACRPVFEQYREQILTLDRSKVQAYFRNPSLHWFYDLGHLVSQVGTDAQISTFNRALDQAVIFKDATPAFLGLKIDHYSGLSVYIPRSGYTVLNNYYKTLKWNQATGLVK